MITSQRRQRPRPWSEQMSSLRHPWMVLLLIIEWPFQWIAFLLGNWAFLEILEYLGSFSVLIAVIFYFHDSGNRVKQRHYQAWQVINTAQGKGGSGGRIEALQELNADGVPLVGVDVSSAFLQGVQLPHAHLVRSNFSAADVRNGTFESSNFADSDLGSANFRGSVMRQTLFRGARLDEADLSGADLSGSDFSDSSLVNVDLRNADLSGIGWKEIRNIRGANIFGVKNAPAGFVQWARQKGAVEIESDAQWMEWQMAH